LGNAAPVAIPAILMGGIVIGICLYFWREGRDLRTAGQEATAILIRKYRRAGDPYMLGIENRFVTAQFVDCYGIQRIAEIRVPSRQWQWLREGSTETILYLPSNLQRARVISRSRNAVLSVMLVLGMCSGGMMVLLALIFLASSVSSPPVREAVAAPPPTKFDKAGVAHVSMLVSPRHDRIAVIDDDNGDLSVRDIASGRRIAGARGRKGWRLIDWRPDGARIAVAEESAAIVLDAASLHPVTGESYSWFHPAPGLTACEGAPVWDTAGSQVAAACGNHVTVVGPSAAHLLTGPADRVLAVAWSASGRLLAAVSDDNYVRAWDPANPQPLAVSEDYPYPRAIWFADEHTVVVIDVALRRYTFRF
jgi:hypothetical protein